MPSYSVHDTDGLRLTSGDGTEVFMEHSITQRSEYLKTVLDCHVDKAAQPLVVVSSDVLSAWLAFVQQPEHQHAEWMPMESLEAILKAADLLIDEETTDEVAHLIAGRLFAPAARGVPGLALQNSHQSAVSLDSLESAPPSPVHNTHKPLTRGRKIGANMRRLFSKVMRTSTPRQGAVPVDPGTPSTCSRSDRTELEPESEGSTAPEVLGRVSEDLALSILHAAPSVFSLLATLPPKLHPLALRAHNPSIDSHHSLIFHFRDISSAVPAARAAASVTHLTSLAFHAVRHPHCPTAPQAPSDAAAVFRAVADMPRLSSFTLKGWILDLDGELKLLQQLRQPSFGGGRLRHLGLSHLRASMTVVAPALSQLAATLTCLDLSHTHLTNTAAHTLALYVGDLHRLRRLLIGSTHLADMGWVALLPPLCRLTALETLDMSSVHVSAGKFFIALPEAALIPGTSEASGAVDGDGEGWMVAPPVDTLWTWLQTLDLSYNRQLRHLPDFGERLACMTGLQNLNCAGMGLFGEHAVDALRAMATLPLLSVDWSYNDISAGAAQLSACLESGWRGLTSLTLCRAEIRCGAAEMLAESLACLKDLQELHMPRNGLATRGGVALAPAVGALCALRVLNLAQNELGDVGAHAIAQHAAALVHLEVLDLSGNGMRGLGAGAAADAAATLPQLRVLALQDNGVAAEGVGALAAALGRCTHRGDGSVSAHGVTPCVLRLWGNKFDAEAADTLRAVAPHGVTLDIDEP